MKHNLKITAILLAMFIVTQFIGLAVLHADVFHVDAETSEGDVVEVDNPYLTWIQPPEPETQAQSIGFFSSLLIAFVIAVFLLFLLTKLKIEFFLRLWFFVVVVIALFLAFFAFLKIIPFFKITVFTGVIISLVLALVLAYIKIYRKILPIHNLTELLIYPGIATVFVPILNVYTIVALLIIISIYDIWAVWKSGIMQKMAKYQIQKLKIFSGFFVPYLSKGQKAQIKKLKMMQKLQKKKGKKSKARDKGKKFRVNIAILGGGDIVFPIITAGVMLNTLGIWSAILVIAGATLGLSYLFFWAEKKKFYPAMPFITAGMFIAILLSYIIL